VPGAPDRLVHRLEVERGQRAQVDDLQLLALLGGRGGGLEAGLDRRPVADQRRGRPSAQHPGGEQRLRLRVEVQRRLLVVPPLRLEEQHRVVALDGLLDHPVRVDRVGAGDDPQAGGVREVRLRRLGVVLDRADPAAERHPDHHGHLDLALAAVVQLRDLGHDLVERREDEPVELDLAHRPETTHGETDGRADDARLGQRRVEHALLAEVLLEPVGDAEDAAELADVLPHHDDLRVRLHRGTQAHVEALAEGDGLGAGLRGLGRLVHDWGRHQCSPPAKPAAYSR
jgi:hypothetical protein